MVQNTRVVHRLENPPLSPHCPIKGWYQCCQLLENYFGQINQKIRPLAKKSATYIQVVLQRPVMQNSNKKFEFISILNSILLPIMQGFMRVTHFKKVLSLFCYFFKNLLKIRPWIVFFAADGIFCGHFCVLRSKFLPVGITGWYFFTLSPNITIEALDTIYPFAA
jgi:hypothetical protein